jgi:hypothetical protein
MAAAWKALDPALRDALRRRRRRFADFAKTADAEIVECFAAALVERPDSLCGRLALWAATCPAAASAAFDAADDGDSRAGGGREAHCCGFAEARARRRLAAAHLAGRYGVLSAGRRARRGRAGLRNGKRCRAWTRLWGREILYVTAAKRLVAFDCAIDMLAGPTEIVVTSERGRVRLILLRPGGAGRARSGGAGIFVTTREDLARAVIAEAKIAQPRKCCGARSARAQWMW